MFLFLQSYFFIYIFTANYQTIKIKLKVIMYWGKHHFLEYTGIMKSRIEFIVKFYRMIDIFKKLF
jgi:hypothetical protein